MKPIYLILFLCIMLGGCNLTFNNEGKKYELIMRGDEPIEFEDGRKGYNAIFVEIKDK